MTNPDTDKLQRIATYVRDHGFTAHVARAGHVLVVDDQGCIAVVRTFNRARQWLGY